MTNARMRGVPDRDGPDVDRSRRLGYAVAAADVDAEPASRDETFSVPSPAVDITKLDGNYNMTRNGRA